MSKIQVKETHTRSVEEVKAGIAEFETMLNQYMVKVDWKGNKAKLSGPISGSLEITEQEIIVEIKLGMMAKMAGIDAQRLEGSIRKRLRSALDA